MIGSVRSCGERIQIPVCTETHFGVYVKWLKLSIPVDNWNGFILKLLCIKFCDNFFWMVHKLHGYTQCYLIWCLTGMVRISKWRKWGDSKEEEECWFCVWVLHLLEKDKLLIFGRNVLRMWSLFSDWNGVISWRTRICLVSLSSLLKWVGLYMFTL